MAEFTTDRLQAIEQEPEMLRLLERIEANTAPDSDSELSTTDPA